MWQREGEIVADNEEGNMGVVESGTAARDDIDEFIEYQEAEEGNTGVFFFSSKN